jgi:valyl-tRNA synthetase
VDFDAEISKAQAKLKKATDAAAKVSKLLNDKSFQAKTSAELQKSEQEKLADLEADIKTYEQSVVDFQRLKLE